MKRRGSGMSCGGEEQNRERADGGYFGVHKVQMGIMFFDCETALASKIPKERTQTPVLQAEEIKVGTLDSNREVVVAIPVRLAKHFDRELMTRAYGAVVLVVVYRSAQLSSQFSNQLVQLPEVHDSVKPDVSSAFSFLIPADANAESATVFSQAHENAEVRGSRHKTVTISTLWQVRFLVKGHVTHCMIT